MPIKAVIFDMDGTITDTSPLWAQATRDLILRKMPSLTSDIQATIEQNIHGLAMDKACQIIKEHLDLTDSLEQLITEKTELACSLYRRGIQFIDGFEQFHRHLCTYNLKTGIATNADDHTFSLTKQLLSLERFFGQHMYNISYVSNICKPEPAIYLYTAQQLQIDPSHCVAIEDSAHGILAAKRAGMYCIGINSSGFLDQLQAADHIIESYHDITIDTIYKLFHT